MKRTGPATQTGLGVPDVFGPQVWAENLTEPPFVLQVQAGLATLPWVALVTEPGVESVIDTQAAMVP